MDLDRSKVTFAQAEGAVPLPSQQRLRSVSNETRAALWAIVYESLNFHDYYVVGNWAVVLKSWHVLQEHKPIDEFDGYYKNVCERLKALLFKASYVHVFDFIQFVLRHPSVPYRFEGAVSQILIATRAAYRLDSGTIYPIQTEEEGKVVSRAFVDASAHKGALKHLQVAATAATAGRWAECITQSVHSVEAISKSLAHGATTLKPALDELERHHKIHGALKQGFLRIYDFTSDEKGLRHSLMDKDASEVDETDALFMLGACSAFVSYLISKAKTAGIPLA
ncbi:AbiJ-NTD4 domain-containing protein [Rhizobium sp. BE258]|uniref:AbiJ-NTD4 domain-containing protein n=1 Tax=Rhizobium sp. BE258 TaxID=2817722 RepID=UPI0028624D33|nr:hypothetical protein [Rhizobium sp. BE258]MDR7148032.1 hypothetical protein [Rhizobium sp. BE258]